MSDGKRASLLALLARRAACFAPRTVEIGGRRIALPAGHRVDWHRFRHRRYDEPIADISAALGAKHPSFLAIDIGANIGVAAVQIAASANARVLCVEGNPKFLRTLTRNLARVAPTSEIAACFVGGDDGEVCGKVTTARGTASITLDDKNAEGARPLRLRSLASILDEHPTFRTARLIKIDTDGFDATIVVGSKDVLRRMQPVLFVEYTPVGAEGSEDAYFGMIQTLGEIGYRWFHVFDNFGNHMLRLPFAELSRLRELGAYLRASRRDESPAVYYFDICAMTDEDRDVSERLVERYLSDAA